MTALYSVPCAAEARELAQWSTPTSPTAVTVMGQDGDEWAVVDCDTHLDADGVLGLLTQAAGAHGQLSAVGPDGRARTVMEALAHAQTVLAAEVESRARKVAERYTAGQITTQLRMTRTLGAEAVGNADPLEPDVWARAEVLADLVNGRDAKQAHANLDGEATLLDVLLAADAGDLTIRSGALWHTDDGWVRSWEAAVADLRADGLLTDATEPATTALGWAVACLERAERGQS